VLLGILLGTAALTKLSGLTLWLFVGCIFAWLVWRNRFQSAILRNAIIAFAVAGVIAAPFFLYNLLTRGDPLGWSFVLQVTPLREGPMTFEDWSIFLRGLYTSFWGRFGGALHLHLPNWLYVVFAILAVCAISGWVLFANDARRGRLDPRVREMMVLFILLWALMLTAFLRWTFTVLGTDQARQLFPGLPLLALALTAGFARLFGKRVQSAMTIWAASFVLSGLVLLGTVVSTFSPVPPIAPVTPNAQDRLRFGNVLELEAYQVSPLQAYPGDSVRVIMQWRALKPPQENYWLFLQLQNNGEGISHKDGVPGAGRVTTDWWQADQVFSSTHTMLVPEDVEPGTYALMLGVHPFQRWEWLPVDGQELMPLADIIISPQR
jgi:hypothetical protein